MSQELPPDQQGHPVVLKFNAVGRRVARGVAAERMAEALRNGRQLGEIDHQMLDLSRTDPTITLRRYNDLPALARYFEEYVAATDWAEIDIHLSGLPANIARPMIERRRYEAEIATGIAKIFRDDHEIYRRPAL